MPEPDLAIELTKFQALYDLALAMTADHSLEENLRLIVDKGRQLLGADKAFIALRDESSNDLYMHTLSGVISAEFKALRIPMGAGLGGKVAETGRYSIVVDYLREVGPAFHDAARAEGLVSGIAVPVKIGETNLGVLYAFNRSKTPFSKDDIDTLSLLGNMAAVEITRKRAEEQLREGRRQFRTLYEESKRGEELYLSLLSSSADAIVIYDLEGRAKYVNPAFTLTFGWTMEEVKGKRIPFLPDSEREATMEVIFALIRDGTPCSRFQTKRYAKDGRVLDISVSASRYHDVSGVPAGTLAILRDITDRKQAEQALLESEENYRKLYARSERSRQLYRTLLDISPDPIVVYDVHGAPTYVNPAFVQVFGWTFEELQGKRIDFVPPENWPETNLMIEKVMNRVNFSDQESRRYTKDGRIIDVSISGAVLPDNEGRPAGSVVHLRDITARKKAEVNLAAELKKFQALYDMALAMIAERSLEENLSLVVEKGRELLQVDKAFLALRDQAAGELFMHTLSGIVTDAFKKVRIPVGVGMGGRVAATGLSYVVEDYFKEVGPQLHEVVRAEGLLSGIAVPVKVGEVNLGVLYAFNRTKTPFTKADLDTLSLLGNLAAVDITRKRSEERLRASEESYRALYRESKIRKELYRSLLHSSADAIVIYDMDGRAQYVSPSFTRIFGWTSDEVLEKHIPFVPVAEREPSMKVIEGIIRDGTPCSAFETKRYTKQGRLLDISISASRYHDHQGNPAGMLVSLRDISDRKRAEERLRESEKRFRTLAEVAPFGLVVMAADETTTYINPKFSELFGYTLADVPDAKSWFSKAYPTEERSKRAAAIWREEAAEIKSEYGIGAEASARVFKVRCKNGTAKITSFRAVMLADGSVMATFLDVTAEIQAQAEIVRAKNRWERTFNAVSDLITIMDGEGKIVQVNKAMADRVGMLPKELIGKPCSEDGPGEETSAMLCLDAEILSGAAEYSREIFDEKLGNAFDLRVSPLRDENGNLTGWVNVARDITAFKSIERARRLAVHHLSHELKTPLAIIKASLKNLAEEDLSPEMRSRNFARIKRNFQRLTDIQQSVEEIVAPSFDHPRHFALGPATQQILDEILTLTAHRSFELVRHIESVETDIIDPAILNRVLWTLVKNAVENTPDQGTITVSLREVQPGVLLQVEDTGVGIAERDRDFLFKAFHHTQQTDRYVTRNPFEFSAGGKALELMHLKILSEEGHFDIWFDSRRCRYMSVNPDGCPGCISLCPAVSGPEDCKQSGGSTFSVLFRRRTH